ncbi:hypothetical protein Pelo_19148 [Pelomyxa schiedti]|nr:hypothetical protein Pelo_19148 [Pelomyxa schiedti]
MFTVSSSTEYPAVVVALPVDVVDESLLRISLDKSADREAVVIVQLMVEGGPHSAIIYVFDMEQTYNCKSLALLSTTRGNLPISHTLRSAFVMRNCNSCSPSFGKRIFIVQMVERLEFCSMEVLDPMSELVVLAVEFPHLTQITVAVASGI